MNHCAHIMVVLLLASLARGQALQGELAKADTGAPLAGSVVAAPVAEAEDPTPFGVDDERFAQFLREDQDQVSSSSLGNSAISTIVLGLALLFAAGPLGRLISGLEKRPQPRRADDPGP